MGTKNQAVEDTQAAAAGQRVRTDARISNNAT